jgi:hypothetical protein
MDGSTLVLILPFDAFNKSSPKLIMSLRGATSCEKLLTSVLSLLMRSGDEALPRGKMSSTSKRSRSFRVGPRFHQFGVYTRN